MNKNIIDVICWCIPIRKVRQYLKRALYDKYIGYNLGSYIIPKNVLNGKGYCVDIGSNVGSFLLKYSDKFKIVHFYEAQKKCFNICKGLAIKNVVGYNEAVYKECGVQLEMVEHENRDKGSVALKTDTLNSNWTNKLVNNILTIDLETVLERIGGFIDYMKVDCETSEYYFLLGKDLSNIRYIGIELHWQMGKDKYNELLAHLNKTHYTNDDNSWSYDRNKEVLYINREYTI